MCIIQTGLCILYRVVYAYIILTGLCIIYRRVYVYYTEWSMHILSGFTQVREKSGKILFLQGQGKVREF